LLSYNKKTHYLFRLSLSCLQVIKNCKTDHPFIYYILREYTSLKLRGYNIVFCWIPSHIGIHGNTKADSAAKQALQLPITNFKIPRRVWSIDRGCLLLHGTWSHLWYIQRSVYAHSLICISYWTYVISYTDLKSSIREYVKHLWQSDWNENINKLHDINPTVSKTQSVILKGAPSAIEENICISRM
jgi:hypothetical protein